MATIKERYQPEIENPPYLITPVKEHLGITEGYIYSQWERERHGMYFHRGVDYETKWGAPVLAAASGYAVATYQRHPLRNPDSTFRLFEGAPMSSGFGYLVQIYHPEEVCEVAGGRITQYGHLSKFGEGIKGQILDPIRWDLTDGIQKYYSRRDVPEKAIRTLIEKQNQLKEEYPWLWEWRGWRVNFKEEFEIFALTQAEIIQRHTEGWKYIKWVDQGDVIGYTGATSVTYGQIPYSESEETPDIKEFSNTWDEIHLHFEEASRNADTKGKHLWRDPYGVYLGHTHYPGEDKDRLFI